MRKLKSILALATISMAMLFTSCKPEGETLITFSISPDPVQTLVEAGQTQELTISSITPDDAEVNFTWTSSNNSVATVVSTGKLTAKVTAVKTGVATITATSGAKSKSVAINVNIGGTVTDPLGSEGNPYSVTQALEFFTAEGTLPKEVWLSGYIVGAPATTLGGSVGGTIEGPQHVIFGTEGIRGTAVAIAASADEKNWEKVLFVELATTVEGLRSAVSLVDNPQNLKEVFKAQGNFERYYGRPGLRDITAFDFTTPPPVIDPTAILDEPFATGQGSFTIQNVTMNAPLTRVWYHNASYKQMVAGAYMDKTNHESESWLISPAMDLSEATTATFTFDHAGKQFGAPTSNLTIQVSTDYSEGAPSTATWTALSIPDHLAGETNNFKSAGNIKLDSYCGNANVHVAFKYTSTPTAAGNWYIKNVLVK